MYLFTACLKFQLLKEGNQMITYHRFVPPYLPRHVDSAHPIQRSVDEDEDDDSCCSTPDSPETPQGTTGELVIDDSAFLRAHFESLTVEKADVLFKPTWSDEEGDEGGGPFSSLSPQRPSISMLYFNKSCTTGYVIFSQCIITYLSYPLLLIK
jgi:hypothetical protein